MAQHISDAWDDGLNFDVTLVLGDASDIRTAWQNRELAGDVLVRSNEARFDGTSIVNGGWNNPDIAWRAIEHPDLPPWNTTSVPAVRAALNDLGPETRAQSFNDAYKVLKDENMWWSAFNTNLPWGVGPQVKAGSYQPWTLVPYLTAIWTVELIE